MSLWRWSVIVFVALSGCATAPPQGPVTTPVPTTRPLAWVLWEESLYPWPLATTWTLYIAHERRAECEEQAYMIAESSASLPDALWRTGLSVEFKSPHGNDRVRYVCLPDTMDSRR
jgi:hypothetical protein